VEGKVRMHASKIPISGRTLFFTKEAHRVISSLVRAQHVEQKRSCAIVRLGLLWVGIRFRVRVRLEQEGVLCDIGRQESTMRLGEAAHERTKTPTTFLVTVGDG
jgi:hypothetical protein